MVSIDYLVIAMSGYMCDKHECSQQGGGVTSYHRQVLSTTATKRCSRRRCYDVLSPSTLDSPPAPRPAHPALDATRPAPTYAYICWPCHAQSFTMLPAFVSI